LAFVSEPSGEFTPNPVTKTRFDLSIPCMVPYFPAQTHKVNQKRNERNYRGDALFPIPMGLRACAGALQD
jgi:hypothetical protein